MNLFVITKIEGIILSKIPFDDRHLICHVLLRNGKKISVMFYGGRGGGTKQKSSILELGYLIQMELRPTRSTKDMFQAKEWNLSWHHDEIRKDFRAFSLLCFYLELIHKLSPDDNLHDPHWAENAEMVGLFRVLSNAIVYLEKSLKDKRCFPIAQAAIFLSKLLIEQGLFPEREHCCLCGEELVKFNDMHLYPDEGGFACPPCMNVRFKHGLQSGRELWEIMGHAANSRYQDIEPLQIEFKSIPAMLFNYLCFQYHFNTEDFKTKSSVF